jgi:nicotinate-nucleotide pyrophosphorylase (carboxylating)
MNFTEFIKNALAEDVGNGDHTTLACIPINKNASAELIAKEDGIIAGVELAEEIFSIVNPELQVAVFKKDGDKINAGNRVFRVSGPQQSILTAERLVLNCMQRMSGIASETRKYADRLSGLHTKVLDTRKTTPGFRAMEKWAVKIGGGVNHRFGLYDMILIKDNHIDYAGSVSSAINNVYKYLNEKKLNLEIEVEARNEDEIKEILTFDGIKRILLDNFSVENTKKAVELINHKCETESSGNINLQTVRAYAECGIDYVSVGALTHSYKSIDLSLKAI